MEVQGDLSPGLSMMVHHGRVGRLHPTQGDQDGKIGTRREFTAPLIFFIRISLAQNSDFHASNGWSVSSTPTTAEQHTHISCVYFGSSHMTA